MRDRRRPRQSGPDCWLSPPRPIRMPCNQIRDLFQRTPIKRKILDELAASADIAALPAPTLCFLGANLLSAGRVDTALSVLRQAQQRFPEDFWVNVYLAVCYDRVEPAQPGEVLRFRTAVVAIHPKVRGDIKTSVSHWRRWAILAMR